MRDTVAHGVEESQLQNIEQHTQSEIASTLLLSPPKHRQGEQKSSTDRRTAHFVFIRRERVVSSSSWGRQNKLKAERGSGVRVRETLSTCTCGLLEKGERK